MNHRSFGKDGVAISEVGLGCWQLGGNWGHVDDETATGILKASFDAGVTFFDTADVYGDGRSETIIGNFLPEVGRDNVFIASKVGRGEMYPNSYTEAGIRANVEKSLQRLKIDSLDLIQTHCSPPEIMKSGEIYEWLGKLVEEGKLKRFGASVETDDEANMLLDSFPKLYSLQIIFNIFRQKPIDTVFEKAKQLNVGIIARVPLASGVLSGKFGADTVFGASDHRNFNKDGEHFNVGETFAGVPFEKAIELAAKLESMKSEGVSLSEMALRWILDFDAVSVVIPGASKVDQAIGNARASEVPPLSKELHAKLKALYENEIAAQVRGAY